ncbi:MAG: hypothetical protein MR867_09655, partial [Eubacterium sp.]|nr:hypothetical protein [Eubacterium sp.]
KTKTCKYAGGRWLPVFLLQEVSFPSKKSNWKKYENLLEKYYMICYNRLHKKENNINNRRKGGKEDGF